MKNRTKKKDKPGMNRAVAPANMPGPDLKIIAKLKRKDPASIREVVEKHNRRLFFLAYRFTNNHDDAEDILQEVWVKFFYSIKNFKGKSSIYTYLYKITVNESLMWLRKNKLKKMLTRRFIEKADKVTPEEIYLKNEKLEHMHIIVDKLPPKQKKVFILRQEGNLPFKEIGDILNIKENNAKTLFFYSLKKVKKYFKERGLL